MRALSNVLGLYRGDEVGVQPTPRVEALIRGGHLQWLDDPARNVAAPVVEDLIPVHDEGEADAVPPADVEDVEQPKVTKRNARKAAADDE